MKKLLVVLGMSVVAMAGKCGSSDADKSGASSEKPAEEFPAKEEAPAGAQEVPSYDQQGAAPTEATPAPSETVTTPSETAPAATDAGKVPSND